LTRPAAPGTASVAHPEDNLKAAEVELSDEQFESLSGTIDQAKSAS